MIRILLLTTILVALGVSCGTEYRIEHTEITKEVKEPTKKELKQRVKILRKKLKKCRRRK